MPQAWGMRVSAVWSLVWGALNLWECPRHHPKLGLLLELAWSADPHMVSFLGHQVWARKSGTADPDFPGLGRVPGMPSPFCREEGQAEKQDAEQAGEG